MPTQLPRPNLYGSSLQTAPASGAPDAGSCAVLSSEHPCDATRPVLAHLAAALAHDQMDVSRGWAHFERHWAQGCALHRHLARSYQAAGLQPVSAIRDEESSQWHVAQVPLDLPLPPASQIVRELTKIYEDLDTYSFSIPKGRRLNRKASLVALASVTAVLDAAEIAPALIALLREQGWFDRALWTREQAPRSLNQLFEFLASGGFRRLLAQQVGARRAARCYARMMARLIPGIGRRLLVADVLWLVFEQWKVAGVVPDGTGLGQLRPVHERIASRWAPGHGPRAPYNPISGASLPRSFRAIPVPLAGSLLHATATP